MHTFIFILALCVSTVSFAEENITKTWAIAEFGEPLYKDGIEHWPYVNPDALKGGKIVLDEFGSFDTLNFYVLKGDWPSGSIGLVYDSLMTGSGDEIGALYGLIAETVEYPEDKSWAIFNIRPEARYHDGKPIRAQDFVFALDTVKEHGRPFIQSAYADIDRGEVLDDSRVKFYFKTTNSMKPIAQVAGMYPLPVHYWEGKDVTASTLEPPLSSGPYQINDLEPGRMITYERVKDYWGADLPVNRGMYNYDEIRYDYYRDLTVMFEAFKAGEIDFWAENSAKRWATEYTMSELETGDIIKAELPNEAPRGIGGFFFNLRRDKFKDLRVRKALLYLYDFEAIQRTLLYGFYSRIKSYFPNSDYGASGPPTEAELKILEPYRDQLPPEVFTEAYEPPVSDGSGRNRKNKRIALRLFKEAGWVLKDSKLVNAETGEQFSFEIMTAWPETERLALPYIEALKAVGIDASIRLVDSAQWRERVNSRDFDLYSAGFNFFPPPGQLQKSYYHSDYADQRGSNSIGIKNPVIDELLDQLVAEEDLDQLKAINRAMDRVLLWNYYAIPLYYNPDVWIAYWNKFGKPERKPRYSVGFLTTWWIDPEKLAQLPKKVQR